MIIRGIFVRGHPHCKFHPRAVAVQYIVNGVRQNRPYIQSTDIPALTARLS